MAEAEISRVVQRLLGPEQRAQNAEARLIAAESTRNVGGDSNNTMWENLEEIEEVAGRAIAMTHLRRINKEALRELLFDIIQLCGSRNGSTTDGGMSDVEEADEEVASPTLPVGS